MQLRNIAILRLKLCHVPRETGTFIILLIYGRKTRGIITLIHKHNLHLKNPMLLRHIPTSIISLIEFAFILNIIKNPPLHKKLYYKNGLFQDNLYLYDFDGLASQ